MAYSFFRDLAEDDGRRAVLRSAEGIALFFLLARNVSLRALLPQAEQQYLECRLRMKMRGRSKLPRLQPSYAQEANSGRTSLSILANIALTTSATFAL